MIVNSSFSTETERSDLLFPYLNGVRGGGGGGDVAKLWVWNDFQFLKPSLHLSYPIPIR